MSLFLSNSIPIFWGLRDALKIYHPSDILKDISAGFIVSLVALPLSMALAITIGLAPQHGLYTAIVAGIIAAIFGGSRYQVSGPTAAFVVILIPIVAEHGLRGIIWCQIIAGFLLILFAIAKLGRLIRYVPYPVTTGFTTGIALVLFTITLRDFLGLPNQSEEIYFIYKVRELLYTLPHTNIYELSVGLITLLTIIYGHKIIKFVPSSILAVSIGVGVSLLFLYLGIEIRTIGNQYHFIDVNGVLQNGIPSLLPRLHWPHIGSNSELNSLFVIPNILELKTYLMPAFTIAILAALESLLSASIADSLTNTRHHPNGELLGVGMANIFSGLSSGIPATAAIARTAMNIKNGAKSPISVIFHSVFILSYMLYFSPFISLIPLSSLAALLIITAYNMSHFYQFKAILKTAPSYDKFVLLSCFSLTVLIDMVAGVVAGILLASFLFMKRISDLTNIEIKDHTFHPLDDSRTNEVSMLKIDGPLFFGTVEKAYEHLAVLNSELKIFMIDLTNVPLIDATGLVAMHSTLNLISKDIKIILCGHNRVLKKILKTLDPIFQEKIICFSNLDDAYQYLNYTRKENQ